MKNADNISARSESSDMANALEIGTLYASWRAMRMITKQNINKTPSCANVDLAGEKNSI